MALLRKGTRCFQQDDEAPGSDPPHEPRAYLMSAKTLRRLVQFFFVTLTIVGVFVVRGNAERWCPFGGVEAIYTYASEGNMLCSLGVSNFYVLAAVLLITILLRRAFCGYMCPIGAISEWLQSGARRLGIKEYKVGHRLDRALASLKYVLLVVILVLTWIEAELIFRTFDPCYALLSRHGEDITFWAYVVAGSIVFASLLIIMPFCRYFCPLAAVLNPFSRFGLTKVRKDDDVCTGCGECEQSCPMAIPVGQMSTVNSARCMSCFNCVEVCKTDATTALTWGPGSNAKRTWPQYALVVLLFICLSGAVTAAYVVPLPSFVKEHGEPPTETAVAELAVHNLTCRGKASLFDYFVTRDDLYALDGYVRMEAWPGPGAVKVRIIYDPNKTDVDAIKEAITEPYYDRDGDRWRNSPFEIEGYDPLALD